MRVTLDTNVFVSALNFGGIPQQILDLDTDEVFVLCISPAIVQETRRILADRFEWPEEAIEAALGPILFPCCYRHAELDSIRQCRSGRQPDS